MADYDLSALIPFVCSSLNAATAADLEHWTTRELYAYADDAGSRISMSFGVIAAADIDDGSGNLLRATAGQANYPYPENQTGLVALLFNGAPLKPATVAELEALDDGWEEAAAGAPTHFVQNWLGESLVRIYPPPATNGALTWVLYQEMPDIGATATTAPVPAALADLFAFAMIGGARRRESDAQMPEAADFCDQVGKFYDMILGAYWGGGI